jgi:hypothetical protein
LHGDAGDHHDAEDGRAFFHRVVVFEDEPLGSDAYAEGEYY